VLGAWIWQITYI